jgi:hypothetical protein
MKLNRSALVFVAMVAGSFAAIGCNRSLDASQEGAEAAATTPASEPVKAESPIENKGASGESTTIVAKASAGVTTQIPAAPKPRYENPGRAPSRDHMWERGRWQWNSREYTWVPGHWERGYSPKAPPAVRYENPGRSPSDRHVWISGYWRWDGREYVWTAGHWDIKRNDRTYVGAHWNKVHGRWQYVPGHWAKR